MEKSVEKIIKLYAYCLLLLFTFLATVPPISENIFLNIFQKFVFTVEKKNWKSAGNERETLWAKMQFRPENELRNRRSIGPFSSSR